MAKGGQRASLGAQSKKKRKVDHEKAVSDEEVDSGSESKRDSMKNKKKNNSKASTKDAAKPLVAQSGDASLSEALNSLKEKFNELHSLRYTEPEQENNDLRKLMSERQSVSDKLIESLENRIKQLDGSAQALVQSRKREREALDELTKSREEIEKLRTSLELAGQERAALTRALENMSENADTSSEAQKLASILDVFKTITGITVKVGDDNNRGSCTIYNPATKKGAKFDFVVKGDELQFTPVANKQLLRPEHQTGVTIKRASAPGFMGKVVSTFF